MPITITFDGTSATVSGLTNGQPYSFRVAAANALGVGPFSAATTPGTPTDGTPPTGSTTPGAPSMTLRGWINDGWKLRLEAPTDDGGATVTHYELQYRDEFNGLNACDEYGSWSATITVPADDPEVTLKNVTHVSAVGSGNTFNSPNFAALVGGLPSGTGLRGDGCTIGVRTDLRFRARAVNANGSGGYSYAPQFDPDNPTQRAPAAPNRYRGIQGVQHGQSFLTIGGNTLQGNWQSGIGGKGWEPYAITYGSGKFVTSFASSPDGENWTLHSGLGDNGGSKQYDVEHCNGKFFMAPLRNGPIPAHRAPAVAGRASDDGRTWFPVAVPAGIVNLASGIHNGTPVFAMAHGGRLYGGGHNFGISFSTDGRTWQSVQNTLGHILQLQFTSGRWYALAGAGAAWEGGPNADVHLYRSSVGSLSGWQRVFPARSFVASNGSSVAVGSNPIGANTREVPGDGSVGGPTSNLRKMRSLVYEAYGVLITYWAPYIVNATTPPGYQPQFYLRWCYSTDGGATWTERTAQHPEGGAALGFAVPRVAWPGDFGFRVGTTPVMTTPVQHGIIFPYECEFLWTLSESKLFPGVIGKAGLLVGGYSFPRASDTNFRGAPTHRWLCYHSGESGNVSPFYYPKSFAHDGNGKVVSLGPAVLSTDPSERWPDGTQKPAQARISFGVHKFPPLS